MFYYKIKDDLSDESFFRRFLMLFLLPFAAFWRKKAIRFFPQLDEIICESMVSQANTEAKQTDQFDIAAHASADALGKVFAYDAADEYRALYRFGYAVGRWVYLMDAVDDLEKDLKKGRYNVFALAFGLTSSNLSNEQKTKIQETLNASEGMALEAFYQTGCHYMRPIIENILTEGMNQVKERLLKGENIHARSL